jgi:hypothetical protein
MDDSAKVHQLEYEETPIIEPIEEKDLPGPLNTPELSTHSRHGKRPLAGIKKSVFFLFLFLLGVGGVTFLRPFFETLTFPFFQQTTKDTRSEIPQNTPPSETVDETFEWNSFSTKAGMNFLTYKLPKEVLPPVCDGSACPSEGTFLPGGTRFTVSTKITNTPIVNFAKLIVKDAGGKVFDTQEATVSGHTAVNFSGSFLGLTTGGYSFTRMHGVMIYVAPTIAVEFNHFSPNGITSEFEKDDAVFSQILKTITFVSTSSATVK